MKTLALVSCGKGKQTEPTQAKEMYTGDLFRKTRAFAEREHDGWLVLSALHGVLHPDKVIAPYDYTLLGKPRGEKRAWAERVVSEINATYDTNTRIVIHAGRDYRKFLTPLLVGLGYTVDVPLEGLGIGQQKSWLKRRLDNAE